ncbi:MAG: hypothetical protein COV35_00785 [Alphaproteobacteria bacterium CG11_big_fil_rev_8_21_14_0_20_39_49]|nr:MAG: hypothetical protein COV35_00785 [Alphaproteobacteria bacterium CG11_big_fil_rev_8_21_14_0_20_39_49]
MTTKNPFFSFFSTMAESNPFAKNFDWEQYTAAGQSNAKAFSEITKSIFDGVQELSSRQLEIAQKNAEIASKFFQDVAFSSNNIEDKVAKQADFAKSSFDSAISNSKELFDTAVKSGSQTGEIINKKVAEAFSEVTKKSANANAAKKKEAA